MRSTRVTAVWAHPRCPLHLHLRPSVPVCFNLEVVSFLNRLKVSWKLNASVHRSFKSNDVVLHSHGAVPQTRTLHVAVTSLAPPQPVPRTSLIAFHPSDPGCHLRPSAAFSCHISQVPSNLDRFPCLPSPFLVSTVIKRSLFSPSQSVGSWSGDASGLCKRCSSLTVRYP